MDEIAPGPFRVFIFKPPFESFLISPLERDFFDGSVSDIRDSCEGVWGRGKKELHTKMDTTWNLSVDPAASTDGSYAGVPEAEDGVHRGGGAALRTFPGPSRRGVRSTKTGGHPTGGRGESGSRHRIRRRVRHPAASGRSLISASVLASFAVFSFLIIYRARNCLNKGLGSSSVRFYAEETDGISPIFHISSPEGRRALLRGERGTIRRLSGEIPSGLSSGSGENGNAAEDALCRVLEASARARRAAAAEAHAETSDEETEKDSPTQPASTEKREKASGKGGGVGTAENFARWAEERLEFWGRSNREIAGRPAPGCKQTH